MRYFVVKTQEGGCDYTIGCGISIEMLSATTMQKAIDEVIGLQDGWKEELQQEFDAAKDKESFLQDARYDWAEDLSCVAASTEQRCEYHIDGCYILAVADKVDIFDDMVEAKDEFNDFIDSLRAEIDKEKRRAEYEKMKKEFEDD